MKEETVLFERNINKMQLIFRIAGIFVRTGVHKTADRYISRCVYIVNFMCANINLFSSIFWCIDGIKKGQDFLGITYSAPCINLSILAQFKGLFLVMKEKDVHELINNLIKLEKRANIRKQSTIKDTIAMKETMFLNYVLKTLFLLSLSIVVGFSLSPIIKTVLKYYKTNQVELLLPFLVWYPFDSSQFKYWVFAYLSQFWSECVVSLNICAADYFFFICCTYIRIQFRLLQHDLENIIPKDANCNKKIIVDETFEKDFKELIKWHQDLMESAKLLETIYSKSTLLNFMSSSLIICLTGFNVTMVNDVAFIVTFLSFLFMSLVQVFFLCFFADLLMTASLEVSDTVYNCQWYMTDAKIGKKLLIVLTRSQDPCKLTASGFAVVNLNSFMRVLSTAYSYFALLQTMYAN